MTHWALIVVVFLVNGEPLIFSKLIPANLPCNEEVAMEFMKASTTEVVQDYSLWKCEPLTSPGRLTPALYPGNTEASGVPTHGYEAQD